jgi:hypothetical protein
VITPPVPHTMHGNFLRWNARAGVSYLVRYAYHPSVEADQGGMRLPVRAECAGPGFRVRFIRVMAAIDAPLALRFRPRIF